MTDTKLLYEDIRPRKGIAIPHTSATRMGTDWRDNSPDLEPVVEIFQGARTNYEQLGAPLAADTAKDAQHIQNAGYQPSGMPIANRLGALGPTGAIPAPPLNENPGYSHILPSSPYPAQPNQPNRLILQKVSRRPKNRCRGYFGSH